MPTSNGYGELSREHEEFRRVVRDFAEAEIAPHAAQWDRDHHFPVDVVQKMGDLGLFGITAPEEYGGAGGDFTSLCVAIEELGRVDQSIGITLSAGVGCAPATANESLLPGTTRLPFDVVLGYPGCTGGGTPTPETPRCVAGGIPSLPPGDYQIVFEGTGAFGRLDVTPVTIRLQVGP